MSPNEIIIRRAGTTDIDLVAPLFDAYRQFYGTSSDVERAHAFLAARHARRESTLWAAFSRDTAIGFAHLYPTFSSVSLAPVVILNDLFVSPEWRRTSVARQLIAAVIGDAESRGAVRVELATQLGNAPARRLYGSLGFVSDEEFTHMSFSVGTPATISVPAGELVNRQTTSAPG